MVSACTIIAANYLPFARVLGESFLQQHPQGAFTVLVIDDDAQRATGLDGRVRWWRLPDIGLDADEIARLAGIYDVTELATAVKPLLLQRLLDEGAPSVIYLDPDICVYAPLDAAAALAETHGIVLTPHTTTPIPRDGRKIDALTLLASGVYNLGFIAVGPAARSFLAWWWQVTQRLALVDLSRHLFTDQRWADYVPCFFTHHLLKDPAYNVAYWNLHARQVTSDGDRVLVDGAPLVFFHFSGFDPARPWLLSRNQGDTPRILLSEHPAVAALCKAYAVRLGTAGADAARDVPYGWSTASCGLPMTTRLRRLYWTAVRAAEEGRGALPPDPFSIDRPGDFLAWLQAPAEQGPAAISRFLYSIYQDRADLQAQFPDLQGRDAARFVNWIWRDSDIKESIPAALLPTPVPPASPSPEPAITLTRGLHIAGYFRAELGVGEAARQLTRAVDAAGLPYATATYEATLSRQSHPHHDRSGAGDRFDTVVLCVNADSTQQYARAAGPEFFRGRYTVGYWFWELEHFPAAMHGAFDVVDEVWTASEFVASAVRAAGRKPVFTMPLPVPVPACPPDVSRAQLGVPDGFLFLFLFDFLSILERKNPFGLIEAFTRAFAPGEGPTLVLKSINGHLRLNDLERLRAAARARPDILVIDRYYTAEERDALLCACDCYVSLHRSEGLGLTMAEAMALGKPVIATAYSGNLQFMTPENSYLVDAGRTAVPIGCDPYPPGVVWADPDLDAAARYMREVYARPDRARAKGEQARRDILTRHTPEASGAAIAARLTEIDRVRRAGPLAADVAAATAAMARPDAPEDAPVAALEALLPHLEAMATPQTSAGTGRLSRLRLAAQRALFAVLRPYWFQQRQLHEQMIAALRQAAVALRREQQIRDGLDRRLRELTRELAATTTAADQSRRDG